MDERDGPFRASPRRAVDELEAVDRQSGQLLGEVRDLEADVVEALALLREEARDTGCLVGRLDELDLRFADREERDPDPIGGDVLDLLETEAKEVAVEAERLVDRADHDRNVMDAARRREDHRDSGDAGAGSHPSERTLSTP